MLGNFSINTHKQKADYETADNTWLGSLSSSQNTFFELLMTAFQNKSSIFKQILHHIYTFKYQQQKAVLRLCHSEISNKSNSLLNL